MDIIFHCDDAGATVNSTRCILQAFDNGLINSLSIVANGDGVGEISQRLQKLSKNKMRIAVHLNLLEGKLLSSNKTNLLLDDHGNLHFKFIDLVKKWLSLSKKKKNELLSEIEQEWRAQIEKVKTVCYPHQISQIDSHEYIHMLPFLFPLVVRLAEEQNIPQIRIPREVYHISENLYDSLSVNFLVNIIKHYVLKILSWYSIDKLNFRNYDHSKYIIGVLYTGKMTISSVKAGIEAARRRKATSVEIIFHIGRAKESEVSRWVGNLKTASAYTSKNRDKEYAELAKLKKEEL